MMKNKLFYGDNLEVLSKHIKDESVDLCYIDPPFNSKRNYNQIYNNIGKDDVAQVQAFVDTWSWGEEANLGFNEIIMNYNRLFTKQSIQLIIGLEKVLGKGSLLAYIVSMTQRIVEIHRVLKPTGSFYLHCDPTSSHYLKLVLDAVFCTQGGDYLNEIIWCYKSGGASKKHFAKKHDVIFRYAKGNIFTFNYEKEKSYGQIGGGQGGKVQYYKDEKGSYSFAGIKDWWEISMLSTTHSERLGYPTQKPEALLERIIKASSNEGDVILDAYCGCGTTVAVSERLKRNWIGIDVTYQSISLILKRLEDTFGKDVLKNLTISGIPEDFESAVALANKEDDKVRKEFEKWLILTYTENRGIINSKKGGDGGVDGNVFIVDLDEKNHHELKQVIFSVKSDVKLNPSVIRDLNGTIERDKAVCGFLLTLYPMNNLVKEASKYGTYHNKLFDKTFPKIEVVSVQEILDGKVFQFPTATPEVLKKAEVKSKNTATLFDKDI